MKKYFLFFLISLFNLNLLAGGKDLSLSTALPKQVFTDSLSSKITDSSQWLINREMLKAVGGYVIPLVAIAGTHAGAKYFWNKVKKHENPSTANIPLIGASTLYTARNVIGAGYATYVVGSGFNLFPKNIFEIVTSYLNGKTIAGGVAMFGVAGYLQYRFLNEIKSKNITKEDSDTKVSLTESHNAGTDISSNQASSSPDSLVLYNNEEKKKLEEIKTLEENGFLPLGRYEELKNLYENNDPSFKSNLENTITFSKDVLFVKNAMKLGSFFQETLENIKKLEKTGELAQGSYDFLQQRYKAEDPNLLEKIKNLFESSDRNIDHIKQIIEELQSQPSIAGPSLSRIFDEEWEDIQGDYSYDENIFSSFSTEGNALFDIQNKLELLRNLPGAEGEYIRQEFVGITFSDGKIFKTEFNRVWRAIHPDKHKVADQTIQSLYVEFLKALSSYKKIFFNSQTA